MQNSLWRQPRNGPRPLKTRENWQILFECVSKFRLAEKKFWGYVHFNCHIYIYITYSVTCNYLPPQSLSPMEHTSHYLHICKNRPHRRPYCQFKIDDTAMDDRVRWKQFLNCLKNLQKRGHQDVKCKCKYRNIVPFCKHFNWCKLSKLCQKCL